MDSYSENVLLIKTYFNDQILGNAATGFFYKKNENIWLITNWHVLSGRDASNGQPLDKKNSGIPNNIRIPSPDGKQEKLQISDKNNSPIWIEHSAYGRNIDVAALLLPSQTQDIVKPLNSLPTTPGLLLAPGVDLFILGFPRGLSGEGRPIWKRASIATEPEVSIGGLPKMLVDKASREGMSGAPVLCRQYGSALMADGTLQMMPSDTGGKMTQLVGIYSGRIGAEDELKAQLGVVWKWEVIDEIVSDGKHPEQTI